MATVVEANKYKGLIVRLAANEDVFAIVMDPLIYLFSTLERYAKKGSYLLSCYNQS